MSDILPDLTTYAWQIIFAILLVVIGRYAARYLSKFCLRLMEKGRMDMTLSKFLSGLIYYLGMTVVVIAALNQLGIETTSIVAVLATAGLAVGLALKDSLSNFAAGVMIIIFRPFVIGDTIEAAGTTGTAEIIGIFTTQLKTADNKAIIVPNSAIISNSITNYSANDTRRVDLTIGVSYESDIKKVKEILAEIVEKDERVLKDPAPTIAVAALADNSVNFAYRLWVKTDEYWNVYFDTLETVKIRFDEEKIAIPYPQMDIHITK
ncbi:mechanosensitive ion channel family protein [Seleniivibrio woodruffii]|uniref:Small conductance mechanosensitive channel n=1 Tax=Seleniivibrio woodruffii TaxID=1078050 RepID=A0A4R1K5A6_9BACT|nr:mechanosensitive ion channel domain-containing protein [Seleniivibrio woodruffii]TCK59324.1 small conductance mechanosensitive channel [Seleniivibrio woodruffii]TVZ35637.1 small conductance mechanosensitive channel [Seleniivibrio woodruffii]